MAQTSGTGGGAAGVGANPSWLGLYTGTAPSSSPNPFTALVAASPQLGGGNSANATEHDLLATLAAHAAAAQHPANAPVPAGPSGPISPYANLDPAQMAANEFAPQYALLDQLAQQAQQKYSNAGNQLGGMWDALAKATAGQESGIKQNYATAGSKIGQAYNDATNTTDKAFSDSRNQIAAIAQRLGVSAAVPSALQQGSDQQGRLDALIKNASANWQGLNTVLGNNDVSYNRNNANIESQAGLNARADFAGQLMAALQGLGNQRLQLAGKQGAAQNTYGLDISKQRQAAQDAAAKLASTDQYHQAEMMLRAKQLQQQANQFNATQAGNANKNLSATEYLAQLANQAYGGNILAATNAKNAILDTIAQGDNHPQAPANAANGHWANASDFIKSVMDRNPNSQHSGGDYRQLQQLALDYYTRLAGGVNKPI